MSGTVDHEPTVSQTVTDGPNPEGSHDTKTIAVNTADVTLEPDENNGDETIQDADSALGGSLEGSDTTSVTSSVYRYRVENGRTYHDYKSGEYFMPTDERELDRLDLQHSLIMMTQDDKLFVCPAGKDKPLKRVLDAGCGTGIWTMDIADEYPGATVIGVDLAPIQPRFTPPNVQFVVDDLESDWEYAQPFDLIYMRILGGSFKDWPRLLHQAFEHTTPGGYIEVTDLVNPLRSDDGTLPPDCHVMKLLGLMVEASAKIGRDLDVATRHRQRLIDAGFVNVVQREYKMPINTWPKDEQYKTIGAWCLENFLSGLEAMSLMLLTNVLGWSVEDVQLLLVGVRKDFKNRQIHAYFPVYVVYGQKPE